MTSEEGIKTATEHMIKAAQKQMEMGNYAAATAILRSAEDLLNDNGYTQKADEVENIANLLEEGKYTDAQMQLDTTLGGWDQGGWDQGGWDQPTP